MIRQVPHYLFPRRLLPPLLAAVLLLVGKSLHGAAPQELDAYAARAMKTFDTPGMAVVIVAGDKTTTHAWGVRKLGAAAPVDEHTIFPIGSNTKAFTAAALAILVDQGKLKWDDRVADRLPGFRMYDAYASQEMTVTDLLVHRSGLGLGAGDLLWFPATNRSRAELVHALRYLKPATTFRSGFAYDNVLYSVAGELIEAVSGQRWEGFVQQHILDVLGMRDTQVSMDARVANQASLHAKMSGLVRGVGAPSVLTTVMGGDVIAPAGSLLSSASDMGHWLRVQLAQGALDGGKHLFSAAASQAMWTPETLIPIAAAPAPLALSQPQFQAYALGLIVRDYRGHRIITHTGGVLGGVSVVVVVPEKQAAFAVLLNSEDAGTLFAMRDHLLDSLLGLSSPDWIANYKKVFDEGNAKALQALTARKAASHPESGPSLPLSGYVGTYRDPWYGNATVSGGKGALKLSLDRSPGMQGTLEHVQYDTFRTHWAKSGMEDAYVTFALHPDGSIDRMTMQAISPAADFSWDYQDLRFTPVAK